MPELPFTLVWPDGARMQCLSPSTILRQHLPSALYGLEDFEARISAGLNAASERVRAVYGHPCSQAAAQLRLIEAACRRYHDDPITQDHPVTITVELS